MVSGTHPYVRERENIPRDSIITQKFGLNLEREREREREMIQQKSITTAASSLQCQSFAIVYLAFHPLVYIFFSTALCFSNSLYAIFFFLV